MQGVCLWVYFLVIKTSVRANGMGMRMSFRGDAPADSAGYWDSGYAVVG